MEECSDCNGCLVRIPSWLEPYLVDPTPFCWPGLRPGPLEPEEAKFCKAIGAIDCSGNFISVLRRVS